MPQSVRYSVYSVALCLLIPTVAACADALRELQAKAIADDNSPVGHWGAEKGKYTAWGSHSSRLIPVYTFGTKGAGNGVDLDDYIGANSAYRSEAALKRIYGAVPGNTLNPKADYCDQTDLATIQRAAFAAGKKYVFLVIFDGMDWQTTWATAIYNRKMVPYREGRGTGLHFLDYKADGTTQFGWSVTSPQNDGTDNNVDEQKVTNPGGKRRGGYDAAKGGPNPWASGNDGYYLIGRTEAKGVAEHPIPDSSATAMAMTTGVKSYNNAINVDITGQPVPTIAHEVQRRGIKIGVVTSVPISHATPACAYSHNVDRDDYQDLTRDLVGLPSISHPKKPLPGVDVLIGGGFGVTSDTGKPQGQNFVPGNIWIAAADLKAINAATGGRYVVAQRAAGVSGRERLLAAAAQAAKNGTRLFGFYGNGEAKGHLPYQTADGKFDPPVGRSKTAEKYSPADLAENPTLADMTSAALAVLETNQAGFWIMIEAGDVDWANHDNNIDNAIGAVNSGDAAVKVMTDWVEKHSNWKESLMIVTSDHGHYFVIDRPELLTGK
jgi:alkaline phosphatase